MTQDAFLPQSPGNEPKGGAKPKEYQRTKNYLFVAGLVITYGALAFLIASRATNTFRDTAYGVSENHFLAVALYFLYFSLFFLVIELPLEFYGSFLIERKYGLSNQTFAGWLWEETKKRLLSFAFSILLVEALYLLIRSFPGRWWLVAWAGWFVVTVVLGKFAHIWILPLFYKSVRLEDDALRSKIVALTDKHKFPIQDVFTINLSKTTKKANAAFTGLGSTRRVLLADTLIENFTHDEITGVVAHELGHATKGHLVKGIVFNTTVSLFVFYVAYRILEGFSRQLGYAGPEDIAALPFLSMVGLLMGLILMPVGNAFSRMMEREADDFAITQSDKNVFISALKKLGDLNLADPAPHPVVEFLLYSHPSIAKRIRRVENA